MQYNALTGEASQSSLNAGSDSSKHTRVLYDDPDSARRHILRGQNEPTSPRPTLLNDSPSAYKTNAIDAVENSNNNAAAPPLQHAESKLSTNPFRNLPSISAMLGFGATSVNNDPGDAGARKDSAQNVVDSAAFGDLQKPTLSPSGEFYTVFRQRFSSDMSRSFGPVKVPNRHSQAQPIRPIRPQHQREWIAHEPDEHRRSVEERTGC